MEKKSKGLVIAAAAAALFIGGCTSQSNKGASSAPMAKVSASSCKGAASCKSRSACKSGASCKGSTSGF